MVTIKKNEKKFFKNKNELNKIIRKLDCLTTKSSLKVFALDFVKEKYSKKKLTKLTKF